MNACCLASSSSGNCYVLTFEKENYTQSIMVECGISINEIIKELTKNNIDMSAINACLITHSHSDHSKSIVDIANRGVKLYASEDTFKNSNSNKKLLLKNNLKVIKNEVTSCIGIDTFLTPFEVEHDASGSMGFIIRNTRTNETILFINDCKYVKYDLSNFEFDYVFIECNYIDKIVRKLYSDATKENDFGMIKRYSRLINAHMSLYGTLKTLRKLNLSKCKGIFLMHLSDGHANEYQMKKAVQNATKVPTFVCGKYGGIK